MIQLLTYLLACSVGLAHVMGQKVVVVPDVVKALGAQCKDRGPYKGACTSQNLAGEFGSGFRCADLICGKEIPGPVIEYEAVPTGPPVDGTQCGKFHVCINGDCLFAGPKSIPVQQGHGPSVKCLQSVIQRSLPPPPSTTRKTVIVTPRPKQSGNKKNDRNK